MLCTTMGLQFLECLFCLSYKFTSLSVMSLFKYFVSARFSPDDKFSRERVTIKKRFGQLLTQGPKPVY